LEKTQKECNNTDNPKINVQWIRGAGSKSANIQFDKPHTHIILGPKDSGKSVTAEVIAIKGEEEGNILDLFGSRDNEGLGWCRKKDVSANEILLIHGQSTNLSGKWDALTPRECTIKELKRYRVVTSVSGFHGSLDEEFQGLNDMVYGVLYKRTHWHHIWKLLIREGANFLYSRIKIVKNQVIAKADFVYLLREARHMGYGVTVDTLKWTSIDLDIRHVSDYTWVKRVGIYGLPHDLRFIYRYVHPPSLMDPPVDSFLIVNSRGPIGMGRLQYAYWHKTEKEDLIDQLGIKVDYGEIPHYGNVNRDEVNDFEHAYFCSDYMKPKGSMGKTAKTFHRSPSTIQTHIHDHDDAVRKVGFCPKCATVKGDFTKVILSKKDRKKVTYDEIDTWEDFKKTL